MDMFEEFREKITRRNMLKIGGSIAAISAAGPLLAACGQDNTPKSSSDMWKQFSGTTLNFISENTPPSSAIAANLKPFADLTGIKVKGLTLGAVK